MIRLNALPRFANENTSFFKRFRQYGTNFFLMPENPDYDPIPLNPGDDVIFLGKVVEWRHIL